MKINCFKNIIHNFPINKTNSAIQKQNFKLQFGNLASDSFEFTSNPIDRADAQYLTLIKLGLNKETAQAYKYLNIEHFEKIKSAIIHGAKPEEFYQILNFTQEEFKKYIEIRLECQSGDLAIKFAQMDDVQYKKIKELMKYGVSEKEALELSELPDEKFQKILKIITIGGEKTVGHLISDENITRCEELLLAGLPGYAISKFIYNSDEKHNKLLSLLKFFNNIDILIEFLEYNESIYKIAYNYLIQGLNPENIKNLILDLSLKENFEKLTEDYSPRIAGTIVSLKATEEFETKDIAQLIKNIDLNPKNQTTSLNTNACSDLLAKNIDIKELNKYIESIDKNKLTEIAPYIKTYNIDELYDFFLHHFENKTDVLNPKNLAINNPEEILANKLHRVPEINKLYSRYPLTKREVGELPSDWLKNIPNKDKDATFKRINNAILSFIETHDEKELKRTLSKTLKKDIKINRLQSGYFGKGYKIELSNARPVCLKIFKNCKIFHTTHGATFEPAAALFANKHSDKYVKMFFGRIADKDNNNGYLITQYLDKTTRPIETENDGKCKIICFDTHERNEINGKIIDFGALRATEV